MELFSDVFGRALLAIALVILMTRIQGLRSFSKMSSFDFSITVAFGSLIAGSALAPDTDYMVAAYAVLSVFLIQIGLAVSRRHFGFVPKAIDNEPLLLMRDGEVIEDALRKARMTRADLLAKLREANVLSFAQVRAVVMESTGDVSVLHQTDAAPDIEQMIEGVRTV